MKPLAHEPLGGEALTSYFCLFSFSLRSNFSASSVSSHCHSSLAFSLLSKKKQKKNRSTSATEKLKGRAKNCKYKEMESGWEFIHKQITCIRPWMLSLARLRSCEQGLLVKKKHDILTSLCPRWDVQCWEASSCLPGSSFSSLSLSASSLPSSRLAGWENKYKRMCWKNEREKISKRPRKLKLWSYFLLNSSANTQTIYHHLSVAHLRINKMYFLTQTLETTHKKKMELQDICYCGYLQPANPSLYV